MIGHLVDGMDAVIDGVKGHPLLAGWTVVLVWLLPEFATLWPAIVIWVLLGLYVWAALAFQRAFEVDRHAAFLARLPEILERVRSNLAALAGISTEEAGRAIQQALDGTRQGLHAFEPPLDVEEATETMHGRGYRVEHRLLPPDPRVRPKGLR